MKMTLIIFIVVVLIAIQLTATRKSNNDTTTTSLDDLLETEQHEDVMLTAPKGLPSNRKMKQKKPKKSLKRLTATTTESNPIATYWKKAKNLPSHGISQLRKLIWEKKARPRFYRQTKSGQKWIKNIYGKMFKNKQASPLAKPKKKRRPKQITSKSKKGSPRAKAKKDSKRNKPLSYGRSSYANINNNDDDWWNVGYHFSEASMPGRVAGPMEDDSLIESFLLGKKVTTTPAKELEKRKENVSLLCSLPEDPGQCFMYDDTIIRWFFDVDSFTCRKFVYSGCGGNGNNFETLEACQKACIKKEDGDQEMSDGMNEEGFFKEEDAVMNDDQNQDDKTGEIITFDEDQTPDNFSESNNTSDNEDQKENKEHDSENMDQMALKDLQTKLPEPGSNNNVDGNPNHDLKRKKRDQDDDDSLRDRDKDRDRYRNRGRDRYRDRPPIRRKKFEEEGEDESERHREEKRKRRRRKGRPRDDRRDREDDDDRDDDRPRRGRKRKSEEEAKSSERKSREDNFKRRKNRRRNKEDDNPWDDRRRRDRDFKDEDVVFKGRDKEKEDTLTSDVERNRPKRKKFDEEERSDSESRKSGRKSWKSSGSRSGKKKDSRKAHFSSTDYDFSSNQEWGSPKTIQKHAHMSDKVRGWNSDGDWGFNRDRDMDEIDFLKGARKKKRKELKAIDKKLRADGDDDKRPRKGGRHRHRHRSKEDKEDEEELRQMDRENKRENEKLKGGKMLKGSKDDDDDDKGRDRSGEADNSEPEKNFDIDDDKEFKDDRNEENIQRDDRDEGRDQKDDRDRDKDRDKPEDDGSNDYDRPSTESPEATTEEEPETTTDSADQGTTPDEESQETTTESEDSEETTTSIPTDETTQVDEEDDDGNRKSKIKRKVILPAKKKGKKKDDDEYEDEHGRRYRWEEEEVWVTNHTVTVTVITRTNTTIIINTTTTWNLTVDTKTTGYENSSGPQDTNHTRSYYNSGGKNNKGKQAPINLQGKKAGNTKNKKLKQPQDKILKTGKPSSADQNNPELKFLMSQDFHNPSSDFINYLTGSKGGQHPYKVYQTVEVPDNSSKEHNYKLTSSSEEMKGNDYYKDDKNFKKTTDKKDKGKKTQGVESSFGNDTHNEYKNKKATQGDDGYYEYEYEVVKFSNGSEIEMPLGPADAPAIDEEKIKKAASSSGSSSSMFNNGGSIFTDDWKISPAFSGFNDMFSEIDDDDFMLWGGKNATGNATSIRAKRKPRSNSSKIVKRKKKKRTTTHAPVKLTTKKPRRG